MSKRERNSWMAVLLGPILVVVSLCALWKNETRFDYYRAASRIKPSTSLQDVQPGQPLAYTGTMDPEAIVLAGQYVKEFVGHLVVYRRAEIYAWDRDEDSDGNVTWSREWMSSVDSNSRNSGIRQELSSETYLPEKYQVSDLTVESQRIEFVDSQQSLPADSLSCTPAGARLSPEGNYFFLRKGRSDQIGDERISFQAIPVPQTATYFGKLENGRGVADRSHERTNFINLLIQDTGILHHLVAGERAQALATMKSHLARLKWIVRGAGTFGVVLGFVITLSKLIGFLFHLPIIGQLAELGVWMISLALGIPLALATILAGFLAGHPVILVVFLSLLAVGIYLLTRVFRRGRDTQRAMRLEIEQDVGHSVDAEELKEMEFMGLAKMVQAKPGSSGSGEGAALLNDWSRKHRWDQDKQEAMMARANATSRVEPDEELRKLIRVAIADGELTPFEMRTIQTAAAEAGHDRNQVREMMASVRRSAELRANMISSNSG